MFMGHFATALVADQKSREQGGTAPFWLFLLASQFLDFLMVAFLWLGLESVEPTNFLKATFANMNVDFSISHGPGPAVLWGLAFGAFACLITRDKWVTLWCAALVVFHELSDLAVGFTHTVMGKGTAEVGFNLYQNAPVSGLIIETVMCAGIIFWYLRKRKATGRPTTALMTWGLYLTLVGGTLATLVRLLTGPQV